MSNENQGRPTRTTAGNGPMGSTVAIIVTLVALVLGFLILRKVNDSGSTGSSTGGQTSSTTSSTVDSSATVSSESTSTTTSPPVKTGTNVQVANASHQAGVAAQMTTALQTAGFTMAQATNASVKVTPSKVLYNASDAVAQQVAQALAETLGGIVAEATADAPPVADGAWAQGSAVVLLLGDDLAGKTLDAISASVTT